MDEFIDYYENNHIPLILSLAPAPPIYKRCYIVHGEKLTEGSASIDFDVMTELGFPDREAFLAWIGKLFGPDAGEQVAADEARFLDRSQTRAYVVDERITSE
ncbi:EthD domain-containing protein [Xanthobacter sp. DSM 24535]|uniref:EthD domain-containing protein n=1 Tax=Roseixanthobacter psychrophilus TaxID=3119917 RepID=UPI00372BE18C